MKACSLDIKCSLDLLLVTSFTQVEDFANQTITFGHLQYQMQEYIHTWSPHGCRGDFQRGTSASWYVSVDICTRAGGSQSGDKAGTVYIVSIVALLTVWVGKVPPNRCQQFAPT